MKADGDKREEHMGRVQIFAEVSVVWFKLLVSSPNPVAFIAHIRLRDNYYRCCCSYCYSLEKERVRMRVKTQGGMHSLGAPLPPRHCLFPQKGKVHLLLEQMRKQVKTPVKGGTCVVFPVL